VESAAHAARAGRFVGELAETAIEALRRDESEALAGPEGTLPNGGAAGRVSSLPAFEPAADGAVRFDREGFAALPELLQLEVLRRTVRDLEPPGPQRWDQAGLRRLHAFALTGSVGKRHPLAGGGWLVLERGILAFHGLDREISRPQPSPELRVEVLPEGADVLTITQVPSTLVDADKVTGDLHLRSFEPGDRMQLAGMEGRKKLSDLYREHGIPADRRASMWVVEDGEGIVWTVGVTTCGRCRITPGTRRRLRLILSPPS
jgi:tRNA(Ile)-lysidine synthetase-like protein